MATAGEHVETGRTSQEAPEVCLGDGAGKGGAVIAGVSVAEVAGEVALRTEVDREDGAACAAPVARRQGVVGPPAVQVQSPATDNLVKPATLGPGCDEIAPPRQFHSHSGATSSRRAVRSRCVRITLSAASMSRFLMASMICRCSTLPRSPM